jgi:hypothetical protein
MQKVEKIKAMGYHITLDKHAQQPNSNCIPVILYRNGTHTKFPSINAAFLWAIKQVK